MLHTVLQNVSRWSRPAALARLQAVLPVLLGAPIPLIVASTWMGYLTADRERVEARQAAFETTMQVARQVADELADEVRHATYLAETAAARGPDLVAFHHEAERLRLERPHWNVVALLNPDGGLVPDPFLLPGTALAALTDPADAGDALRAGRPSVGGVGPLGAIAGEQSVAVRVPILRDGELQHVLHVGLAPEAIRSILQEADAPEGWAGAIADARGNIVARTVPDRFAIPAPADHVLRAAVLQAHEGFYSRRTSDDVEIETVYRSVPDVPGWSVHFGVPGETLNGPVARATAMLAAGGAVSLMLAGGLTLLITRDIAYRRREAAERAALELKLSEDRGAVAIEAAELGTWRWDVARGRVTGSERACLLLGLSPAISRQRNAEWRVTDFLSAVHEEDRGSVEAALRECAEKGQPLEVDFRAMRTDGSVHWVRARGRSQAAFPTTRAMVHGVLGDLERRKRIEDERRSLLRRLAVAQEDEQRRIARELHDQVGQTVTGLSLGLKRLETTLEQQQLDQARRHVRWLQDLATEIGRDIHRASSELRPTALDDLGLQQALVAHASEWSARYGVAVDVQRVGPDRRLPAEVETVLYRVAQEALTNVLKHAAAGNVSIVLERGQDGLRLIVEDDGSGFDAEEVTARVNGQQPLGLSGMRERLSLIGGQLNIESQPGQGTALFIHVPLPPDASPGTVREGPVPGGPVPESRSPENRHLTAPLPEGPWQPARQAASHA